MTTRAASHLADELMQMAAPADTAFRVLRRGDGADGFTIRIDVARPEDAVLRHHGRAVLLVDPTIAASFGERRLDVGHGVTALTMT